MENELLLRYYNVKFRTRIKLLTALSILVISAGICISSLTCNYNYNVFVGSVILFAVSTIYLFKICKNCYNRLSLLYYKLNQQNVISDDTLNSVLTSIDNKKINNNIIKLKISRGTRYEKK